MNQICTYRFQSKYLLILYNGLKYFLLEGFLFQFHLKFVFSKKATKIDEIVTVYLTLCSNCQINGEDFVNFCGFPKKYEL